MLCVDLDRTTSTFVPVDEAATCTTSYVVMTPSEVAALSAPHGSSLFTLVLYGAFFFAFVMGYRQGRSGL